MRRPNGRSRRQGEWDAAEAEAVAVLGTSAPHSQIAAGRVLGLLQSRRGQPSAWSILRRAWDLAVVHVEEQNLLEVGVSCAEHMWLSGESHPDVLTGVIDIAQSSREHPAWRRGDLTVWLSLLGTHFVPPGSLGEPQQLFLDGRYSEAARVWSRAGYPYEAAVARSQADTESQLIALREFERLGAVVLAERTRRGLTAQGIRVPRGRARTTRDNTAGLTARQMEVLGLLADGLSNAQIADALFLSTRTVENHVASVLMKLGAPDRVAAVAVARDAGVLSTSSSVESE